MSDDRVVMNEAAFDQDKKAPWWKFWLHRKRQPVAWLVTDNLGDGDEKVLGKAES